MSRPPLAPVHFLLVDDLEENLVALEALLRRDGLVLLLARSGPDALELLLEHDVALAIVDVRMPGMDGFELAELMRGAERTRRVPIIFLTAADAGRVPRFRGYEAGAVDFLTKPVEEDVLRSKAEVFFQLYRQRQEVARLVENLREADHRKDVFLATLAHELRGPLAPIQNAVEMLRLTGPHPPEATRAHELIGRQLKHLVRLVDDLLEVSRVSRGKVQLQKGPCDLAVVARHAVEASRPLIDARGHALAVRLPEAPCRVEGDLTRLTQVVSNLLNNAAKYTDEGGQIALAVGREGPAAVVRVRDNGRGVDPAALDSLFDLFYQAERHLDRSEGGLGIGLSLVKSLVQLHGGTVEARSEGPGKGSEFVVRLPALPEAPAEAAAPGQGPARAPGARFLVVDDNRDSADSMALLLRVQGHEALTAYDGARAAELALAERPAVVLMDLGLPGLDGYQACRAMRLGGLTGALIVATTGFGQEEDRRKSREAGFDAHLVKPVDLAAVMKLLAERQGAGG